VIIRVPLRIEIVVTASKASVEGPAFLGFLAVDLRVIVRIGTLETFLPQRKTAKLSIICEYFPEAMSLFSLRRSCSSTPTLAGLAIAQPLLGQAVSSAVGAAVFPERNNAEEAGIMSPARGTSMPRFFTEAPSEHVMARGEL